MVLFNEQDRRRINDSEVRPRSKHRAVARLVYIYIYISPRVVHVPCGLLWSRTLCQAVLEYG